jgi:hypothetical protein
MLILGTLQTANSTAPEVVIQSLNYRDKIHPDEKFSVEVVFVCNDVNGWATAKLYLKEPELTELKTSGGVWCGVFGKNAGENITVTLSDITLSPKPEPYKMEVTMFWQPLSLSLNEIREDSKSLEVTVVNIVLSADCLPNSVNMNEVFTLQCSITNGGNDVAHDATVSIADSRDFSVKGQSHEGIGDIKPRQPKSVSFNMSSPFAIWSGTHSMVLRLAYRDWDNREYASTQELSIKVDVPPEVLMGYWTRIAIILAIFIVIVSFVVARRLVISKKGVTIIK